MARIDSSQQADIRVALKRLGQDRLVNVVLDPG
jgi:hypothetical protein